VRHGENIILADDPADFAQQVVDLLRDPPRRQLLGHAARKLVEESYGWPAVAAHFDSIMQATQAAL
jgi:polysaccharide biosynthesis protein PslH